MWHPGRVVEEVEVGSQQWPRTPGPPLSCVVWLEGKCLGLLITTSSTSSSKLLLLWLLLCLSFLPPQNPLPESPQAYPHLDVQNKTSSSSEFSAVVDGILIPQWPTIEAWGSFWTPSCPLPSPSNIQVLVNSSARHLHFPSL